MFYIRTFVYGVLNLSRQVQILSSAFNCHTVSSSTIWLYFSGTDFINSGSCTLEVFHTTDRVMWHRELIEFIFVKNKNDHKMHNSFWRYKFYNCKCHFLPKWHCSRLILSGYYETLFINLEFLQIQFFIILNEVIF